MNVRSKEMTTDLKIIFDKLAKIENLIRAQNLYQKEVYNFKEATEFLDLSHSYLYKLSSRSDICHFKPGGKKIYFHRKDLIQWMLKNRVSDNHELIGIAEDFKNNNNK